QNPHVGTIFLIPGREETLRVNGRAWIVRDDEILESLRAHDKRPLIAIGVEVEECFFHCPKAFRRSGLWDSERWLDRAALPPLAPSRTQGRPGTGLGGESRRRAGADRAGPRDVPSPAVQ